MPGVIRLAAVQLPDVLQPVVSRLTKASSLPTSPGPLYLLYSLYGAKADCSITVGGGEGGIRTPDTVARMPHFECGAFNHSATSPHVRGRPQRVGRGFSA
jgi:hypothetical protein